MEGQLATEQQILAGITARRDRGIPDLGAELRRRISELGDLRLDTPERQRAFSEVFVAFTPPQFDLYALPDECAISVTDNTIQIVGLLVDTARRQCVGQLWRTITLDLRFANHDLMKLQQPYRANALAPVLINQSFAFYDSIGIIAVFVHAALETGRWYWGRLGFEFFNPAEARAVRRWGSAVVRALGLSVDVAGMREARQWALLGSTPPEVETSFEAIAQAMQQAHYRHFQGVPIADYLRLVAEANRLRFDQQIPLGRAIMLSGPDWHGIFHLFDNARRHQLEVYMRTKLRQAAASHLAGP